mgnify:FL=1
MLIKILITGYFILATAILLNVIAFYLEIYTWYDLIHDINKYGVKRSIAAHNLTNIIWLYYLYPSLLALGYIIGDKVYHFLFKSCL